ncbi:MAG: phosphotransferase [Armatimonadetes bacterium]|nr:phosphotransferase [Armatimonadota bacterium]
MKPYREITRKGQIRRMRGLALAALKQFEIEPLRVEFLTHGENTTFRVSARSRESSPPESYLLRIHIDHPTYRDTLPVLSELQWLQSLRRSEGLEVPEPVPTRDGAWVVREEAEGVPGARSCVLFRWMEGSHGRDRHYRDPDFWDRMGEFLGKLHRHSEYFSPPPEFTRQRWDGYECYYEQPLELGLETVRAYCTPEDADLVRRVLDQIRRVLTEMGEGREVFGLVHADMHGGNRLVHRGRIKAIDFDDGGFGHYLYDIVLVLRDAQGPDCRNAFLRAYRRIRSFPEEHERYFHTFRLLRGMNMYVWCLGDRTNAYPFFGTPEAEAKEYVEDLRDFLQRTRDEHDLLSS